MWDAVVGGLISSGVLLFLLGALGAMTWGRVTDNFKTINETLHKVDKCIDELYEGRNRTNERVTRLEAKVERSLNGTKTTRRENNG